MELDDLRFNDKDVRRILKLSVKREKDRYSGIDTGYDSAATYQDLMKVTEDRGLNPDVVRAIVENQEYRAKNRFYEVLRDNVGQFLIGGVAGLLVGAGAKYLGNGEMMNPVIYGAAVTSITDVFEFTMVSNRRGDVKKTVQNDVGTFAGNAFGYTLASLL